MKKELETINNTKNIKDLEQENNIINEEELTSGEVIVEKFSENSGNKTYENTVYGLIDNLELKEKIIFDLDSEEVANFNFSIGYSDILFVLTLSNKTFKENIENMICKMIFIREIKPINMLELTRILSYMNIEMLNIISIHPFTNINKIKLISLTKPTKVNYIEISLDDFLTHIKNPNFDFLDCNINALYILRGGSFIDVKNLFTNINGHNVQVVGGKSSQKSHILSHIDFRLASYLMAMYSFDFKYISYLNTFNDIPKHRYTLFPGNNKYKTTINEKNRLEKKLISYNTFNHKKEYHTYYKHREFSCCRKLHTIENKDSIFSYLDQIDDIISSSNTLFEAQHEIEKSWLSFMKLKLEDPNVSTWKKLPQLIKTSVHTIEKHQNKGILKKRFNVFSSEIYENKEEILLFTISMLITNYNRISATNISVQLGNNIAFLLYRKQLVFDEDNNIQRIKNKFDEWKKDRDIFSTSKLLKLGDYFINIFTNEPTPMFEFGVDEDNHIETNSERIIKISPEYLDAIKETIIIHPASLPMICEPLEWSENKFGGFIENKYIKDPINTGSKFHGHEIKNKENLYKAVNHLNKTEFSVNKELLDYILNEGSYLLEHDKDQKELQNIITIKVAQTYSKYKFYLNLNCDWRGRLYTNSFFLTYQGGDLSRSLIEFYKGEKLTDVGLKYLYIYGANCYSSVLNKKSIVKRINWVKKNLNSIINMDTNFLNKANKKLQFAAFCLAVKNYELNNDYPIRLPIFLDATCSGIQHLSAILKDINLGSHVNLIARSEKDDVGDIYKLAVEPINKAINKYGNQNNLYSNLIDIKLTRDILKTPIMTQVYNVTISGIFNQLKKKLNKQKVEHPTEKTKNGNPRHNTHYIVPIKKGKEKLILYTDVYKISEIIYNEIFNIFPALKEIYNYFINSAKLMVELKLPLIWFTPAGLQITQFYYTSTNAKVKLSYFGKTKTSVIREWLPIVDKLKQSQAIIPNIIHSLDASHLIKVINTSYNREISPIVSIHDCFGTLPNNMCNLSKIIRSEFALLYSCEPFLVKYHEKLISSINENNSDYYEIIEKDGKNLVSYYKIKDNKDGSKKYINKIIEIPNVPKTGSLDLKEIINAIYLTN
jgi:hypothetical protein